MKKSLLLLVAILGLATSALADNRLTLTVPANQQCSVEVSRDGGAHWRATRQIVGPHSVRLFIQPKGRRIYRLVPSKIQDAR